ncbi:MAG: nitroreductase family protein [Deltaproteobacteria bacterium]|nr:nitroreductase family protein [Deltaproteobacteria bacterium]
MELADVIKGRRSVRKFKPDPVPKEQLERILELAQWAPSAMNRQESFFVVVQGQKKEELRQIFSDAFNDMRPILEKVFAKRPKIIEGMKIFFEKYGNAPVFIFAYAGKLPNGDWDTHSTAVAVQNLLLAAYVAGLGATWTDGVMGKEKEINDALGIEDKKLVCVVPVGEPDEEPRVPPRREDRVEWIGF